METHLANMIDDLLPLPTGERYWHFYDWVQGLDGTVSGDCTNFDVLNEDRFDAVLNAFFILAVEAAGILAQCVGAWADAECFENTLGCLRRAFHNQFWDSSKYAYRAYVGKSSSDVWSELVQSMALSAKVCP